MSHGDRSPRPVVTFLTDFGLQDTYVGQMKAVVLSRCPDATLIDLTHSIPPQSVLAGSVHLGAAWNWFPRKTIHVAIVDPGVGSTRRAIALVYRDHVFVGPDNGLFDGVLKSSFPDAMVELPLTQDAFSRTFHGRDLFAPAAGAIASGVRITELGSSIDPTEMVRMPIPEPTVDQGALQGEILFIDHYGNAITNLDAGVIGGLGACSVTCGAFTVPQLSHTYADVGSGEPLALISSMGTLELAVRDGSASTRYDLACGMRVSLIRV